MATNQPVELTDEDLSAAIEATEQEIFQESTGAEEPDNSGDTSLEQMSETFDESDLDDEEADDEATGDEGEAEPEDEAEELEAEAPDNEQAEESPPVQDRRGIPSSRLREESERRRAAETELSQLRENQARLQGQLDMLARQQQQPPQRQQEQPAKPDMFADPEGYERWMLGQAEARAQAQVQAIQERMVNASMARAHQQHGDAFQSAYDTLKNLDPRNPANVATVRSVLDAPDPGAAVMEWHEKQQILADPAAYRESLKQELLAELRGGQRGQRGNGQRRMPPSLNGASGTGATRQHSDPRGLNGSESSIFDYVFDPSAG